MPTVLLQFRNAATLGEVTWGTREPSGTVGMLSVLIWALFAKIRALTTWGLLSIFVACQYKVYIKIFQPHALVFYSSPVLYNSV